ncbi:MAG: serine/threonine-protein kinase [Acidobacteriota bacterium]
MFTCPTCQTAVAPALTACPSCGALITDFLRRHNADPLDGKYQILSVLGIGGMGEVYKALHVHLHAIRVIKLMRANIAGDRESHDRFLREARLATRIQHPNVAALFDFSALPDGSFYMVWEYIEGTDLRKFVLQRNFLRPAAAIRLAVQALMGLEAVHRAGIVHRDVSPENLMVTRDEHGLERIKIIDLGVAKQWNEKGDDQTKTGIFIGKFKYCSPEQLGMLGTGERIDGRADIYSFALVLYEMLTGVAPFDAETPHQYLVLHSSQMPRPLRKANPQSIVPPQLEALIFRGLAKDRERRFHSAAEFAKALDDALLAIPEQIEYPSTVVAALPVAQSVKTNMPAAEPTKLRAGVPGMVDTASGRRRDLFDQIVRAIGEEQYAKADVALQTLKMHLGVKAETDGDYRRLRKEADAGAKDKEASFVEAIERAKQSGKPKEVQRLLAEREERLGRRFGDPSVKLESDVWLRRRDELLAKARSWMTAESFATAGRVLEELAEHLEDGAVSDDEFVALRQSHQQALVDSSEKMRHEIATAHAQENIAKTRRLLSMYDARFGQERRKHSSITAAEGWIKEMDAMRATSATKGEAVVVDARRRRGGLVALLIILALLGGGALAAWHWKDQTIDLWRRLTRATSAPSRSP